MNKFFKLSLFICGFSVQASNLFSNPVGDFAYLVKEISPERKEVVVYDLSGHAGYDQLSSEFKSFLDKVLKVHSCSKEHVSKISIESSNRVNKAVLICQPVESPPLEIAVQSPSAVHVVPVASAVPAVLPSQSVSVVQPSLFQELNPWANGRLVAPFVP